MLMAAPDHRHGQTCLNDSDEAVEQAASSPALFALARFSKASSGVAPLITDPSPSCNSIGTVSSYSSSSTGNTETVSRGEKLHGAVFSRRAAGPCCYVFLSL